MQNAKIRIPTIILLLLIIISGGYGIISLLQSKAIKANYLDSTLTYYEQCTKNLYNKHVVHCQTIRND